MRHLQEKVISAVGKFMERDARLLELEAHEQAITHRIAFCLEACFPNCRKLSVDCEYDKHLQSQKRGAFDYARFKKLKKQYPNCSCKVCRRPASRSTFSEKAFRPDILVHSRGNDDANLIVIEIKMEAVCPFNITKLEALTRPKRYKGQYGYQLGVFLYFPTFQPQWEWVL